MFWRKELGGEFGLEHGRQVSHISGQPNITQWNLQLVTKKPPESHSDTGSSPATPLFSTAVFSVCNGAQLNCQRSFSMRSKVSLKSAAPLYWNCNHFRRFGEDLINMHWVEGSVPTHTNMSKRGHIERNQLALALYNLCKQRTEYYHITFKTPPSQK